MVASWLVVDWGGVVDGGRVVNWGRLVRSRGRLVGWDRDNLNNWLVWSWGRCIHNRGRSVWGWGRPVCWGWDNNWLVWSWGRDNNGFVWSWGRDNLNNRKWGRLVWSWGRLISWWRSWFVGSNLGIDSLALVFHISDIALRSSSVGDNLNTTIGKVDSVLSGGVVVSTVLLMCENSSRVFWVVDSILVIVDWRQVRVSFLGGIGGGGTGGRGYSNKCGKKDL